jgi:Ca2+-transporting ATPase
METLWNQHWHHLSGEEILRVLECESRKGLDAVEIQQRQERFGKNVLTPARGRNPLLQFLSQFHNPLIYILLAATILAGVLKDVVDAGVIFGAVLVNAIVGYLQEAKAERAISALARTMTTEATVPAAELVPGDIVLLQSGDRVPANLRLLQSRELQIAEAALTGERIRSRRTPGNNSWRIRWLRTGTTWLTHPRW